MIDYVTEVRERGFTIMHDVMDQATVQSLIDATAAFCVGTRQSAGARNILRSPVVRDVASGPVVRSLIEPILGSKVRSVRGIYFDKQRLVNWKVAWHQDLTIAVKLRRDTDGYTAWSLKAGIQHVQPPVRTLEQMLAVRIHLDDTDESNGALRVIPGSHLAGRLNADAIRDWTERLPKVSCPVMKGGVMLMRPLLLHASSAANVPGHRRVVHIEFAAGELAEGLEWFEQS